MRRLPAAAAALLLWLGGAAPQGTTRHPLKHCVGTAGGPENRSSAES
eukprot:SAG22_NODE_3265_length_1821_cov_3.116144_1_plen_46_part_10